MEHIAEIKSIGFGEELEIIEGIISAKESLVDKLFALTGDDYFYSIQTIEKTRLEIKILKHALKERRG